MMTLEFFKSLNFDDGLSVVTDIFERFPLQAIDKAAFVAENIDTVLYIRCQSGT